VDKEELATINHQPSKNQNGKTVKKVKRSQKIFVLLTDTIDTEDMAVVSDCESLSSSGKIPTPYMNPSASIVDMIASF
jgi:hypothetical protein